MLRDGGISLGGQLGFLWVGLEKFLWNDEGGLKGTGFVELTKGLRETRVFVTFWRCGFGEDREGWF